MSNSIDVCVATYKRPALLGRLLTSLALQSIRESSELRVIVVDNDSARSAEPSVESFKTTSGMEVVYDAEPRQGISYARNRALSHVNAPLVAFIDDDEEASLDWLRFLMDTMERHGADVVFGPVTALLPDSAPDWAKTHPSFHRPRIPSGAVVTHGATNNVLFRSSIVQAHDKPFDERFALTGGEDTEFFYRMHSKGCRLVWCDEAEVSEHAPSERLTIRWVCRRAYRGGQTYFRIFVARKPVLPRVFWLAKRLVAVLVMLPVLPLVAMTGSGPLVIQLTRISGWLGQLSQIFGQFFQYEEYRGGEARG